jgi:hypothetical protein
MHEPMPGHRGAEADRLSSSRTVCSSGQPDTIGPGNATKHRVETKALAPRSPDCGVEMSVRCSAVILKEKLAREDHSWLLEFVDCRLGGEFDCSQITSNHDGKDKRLQCRVWKRRGVDDQA